MPFLHCTALEETKLLSLDLQHLGLLVAPYAVISVLNLLGSLFCLEFPAIYMVESSIMKEARRRGDQYVFEGIVGQLDEDVIQLGSNATPTSAAEPIRWITEVITVQAGD
jgi:hypothetical protein